MLKAKDLQTLGFVQQDDICASDLFKNPLPADGTRVEALRSIISAYNEEKAETDIKSGRATTLTSDAVAALFRPILADEPNEQCWTVYLTADNSLVKTRISTGTDRCTLIDVPSIVKGAIRAYANAVILVHNHPKGKPKASAADSEVTLQLTDRLKQFGIPLLDHLVLGQNEYFSFKACKTKKY